jgi:hypothetical protein
MLSIKKYFLDGETESNIFWAGHEWRHSITFEIFHFFVWWSNLLRSLKFDISSPLAQLLPLKTNLNWTSTRGEEADMMLLGVDRITLQPQQRSLEDLNIE